MEETKDPLELRLIELKEKGDYLNAAEWYEKELLENLFQDGSPKYDDLEDMKNLSIAALNVCKVSMELHSYYADILYGIRKRREK